eukprot:128256-Pyramimonas_sp.AAC.1
MRIEDMYENRNAASSLRTWFFLETPCNLKCPDPPPVVFSHVPMVGAYHAGAPAGGSDGSWIQAQSAD